MTCLSVSLPGCGLFDLRPRVACFHTTHQCIVANTFVLPRRPAEPFHDFVTYVTRWTMFYFQCNVLFPSLMGAGQTLWRLTCVFLR
jgi:hypothetical protein